MKILALTSDSSAWEVEAGRSGLQGQTHLCSKFKTSLGYMKTSLKTEKKNFPNLFYHTCGSLNKNGPIGSYV